MAEEIQVEAEAAAAESPPVQQDEHVTPYLDGESFHCLHCGVLAQQRWLRLRTEAGGRMNNGFFPGYRLCTCSNCHNKSVWNEPRSVVSIP